MCRIIALAHFTSLLAGVVKYSCYLSAEEQDCPNKCLQYDTNLCLVVRLQAWSFGNIEYQFITIISRSTLTQNGSIC